MKLFVSQVNGMMRLKGLDEVGRRSRLSLPLLLVTSLVISLSCCSSSAHADTLSAPETEVGGGGGDSLEEHVNACELYDAERSMFCNCDSPVEEVKCNVWGFPVSDEKLSWTAIGDLRTVVNLEFNNRPQGSLKQFPPASMFQKLNRLTVFGSKFSKFENIPSYAFANSSTISEVTLRSNMIETLGFRAFANMKNLTRINLEHNSIEEINREVFLNLPNLDQLYLDSNEIVIIHDFAFRDLGRLTDLGLKKNNLTVLAREVFAGLGRLTRLDLQENCIEFLGDHVFADMPNLYDIDLSGNQIRSISSSALYGLKNLGRISMKHNKIVTLDPPVFSHLTKIYMMDFKYNALETFSEALAEPIYSNLLQPGMQLMLEGNRLTCDCKILWLQKLYRETESSYLKETLNRTQCDSYHSPEQKRREVNHGLSVSYNSNVTVDAAPPEETTTYAFDGSRNVLELNTEDLKCHEQQDQKDSGVEETVDSKLVVGNKEETPRANGGGEKKTRQQAENHSKVHQSHHQSHIDISSQISKDDPILISKESGGSGSGCGSIHVFLGFSCLLSFTLSLYNYV